MAKKTKKQKKAERRSIAASIRALQKAVAKRLQKFFGRKRKAKKKECNCRDCDWSEFYFK
jgi:DNA topoisomerase VI subunit B